MGVISRDSHAHGFEMREYIADGGIYLGSQFYEHTIVHGGTTSVGQTQLTTGRAAVVYVYNSNGAVDFGWRFYVYFASRPTTNETTSHIQATIGALSHSFGSAFNASTNKMRAFVRDSAGYHYGSDADLVISTGEWYRIEVSLQGVNGVNGPVINSRVAVARASDEIEVFGGQTVDSIDEVSGFSDFECYFGPEANPGSNYTDYIDDIIMQYGGPGGSPNPEYPLGRGETYLMVPQSTGTISPGSEFTDSAGNTPPVNAHTFVDDVNPAGDYIFQNANDLNAFINLNFGGMPETSWVYGITGHINHALSAAGTGDMRNKLESPDTGSEKDWLTHSSSHTGEETLFANEFVYAIFPGSNPPDSAAKINNLYHQYGFSNDTSPNSRLHSVIYEIAYRTGGAVVPGGGVEHEREPFPTHVAQWREHPWTMRAHGRR